MGTIGDPLSVGAVESRARPGGNVTGFRSQNHELEDKWLELLRELVSGLRGIAILGNAGIPYSGLAIRRVRELATAAGLTLDEIDLDEAVGADNDLAAGTGSPQTEFRCSAPQRDGKSPETTGNPATVN